jgi:hypothetical protein
MKFTIWRQTSSLYYSRFNFCLCFMDRHGRDRMLVEFTTTSVITLSVPITTKVVSSHYVMKFDSDLRQVMVLSEYSGFLHQ